ncbi:MAG: hypothetical protein JSS02_30065, partial [Planctomycetes bacterium]|nr:hypothetical protein [Planctomycetota bacterium]
MSIAMNRVSEALIGAVNYQDAFLHTGAAKRSAVAEAQKFSIALSRETG